MLLEILIPTYNRAYYLEKNIKELISYIKKLHAEKDIGLVVSNNYSLDSTAEILNDHIDLNIQIYNQERNIGLEKNAVFCLSKAKADYVMYLGDDDYLEYNYLSEVYQTLKDNINNITCILPALIGIDMEGVRINKIERDSKLKNQIYQQSNSNTAKLMIKGHQLSGIAFLRKYTLETYLKNDRLRNIYLFIFFVGFNMQRGNTYHLTQYPVKVTQPPQDKKDWNYGEDGLYNERFKNTKALFNNNLKYRILAEFYIIKSDSLLYYYFGEKGVKKGIIYLYNFMKCKDGTLIIRLVYLLQSIWRLSKKRVKRLLQRTMFK